MLERVKEDVGGRAGNPSQKESWKRLPRGVPSVSLCTNITDFFLVGKRGRHL